MNFQNEIMLNHLKNDRCSFVCLKIYSKYCQQIFLLFVPQKLSSDIDETEQRAMLSYYRIFTSKQEQGQKAISKILKIDSPRNKNCYCLRIKPFVNQK